MFFFYSVLESQQTEYKRIISPLKYQTRCVAAFPDQQGFLVCIHLLLAVKYPHGSLVCCCSIFNFITAVMWGDSPLGWGFCVHAAKSLYSLRMLCWNICIKCLENWVINASFVRIEEC